jgi:polyisoprenoid-binding protein YceI
MSPTMARRSVVAVLLVLATAASANAQTERYSVDTRASLAWWQINPHFNHLWATTCPSDPSWQPGEGRSPGYYVDYLARHDAYESGRLDSRIPLYPRKRIRYVCRQAVHGQFDVANLQNWQLNGGSISVLADSLVTGLDQRDNFARRSVLNTDQYPAIRFTVDSLANKRTSADTLWANAVGTFELRGIRKIASMPLKAWPEGGGIRVQTHYEIPGKALSDDWGMSKRALGMGVAQSIWKEVHMGVDILLVKSPTQPSSTE